MNSTLSAGVSHSHAALVLIFGTSGAADRRYPLDRDALIIGKGRGCDLVLDAPDISTIHCVVTRNAGGYTVRDCESRSGTKLNGDRVREATLHDGDLVQIGPFSFRVLVPAQRVAGPVRDAAARLLRLERKRRNLAKLALNLRRCLRDHRHRAMSQQEQRLAEEAKLQATQYLGQEQALARRQAELEADFDRRKQELEDQFNQRQQQLEQDFEQWRNELAQGQSRKPAELPEVLDLGAADEEENLEKTIMLPMLNNLLDRTNWLGKDEEEEARRLLLRRRELDHYSRHLRRLRDRLSATNPPQNQSEDEAASQPPAPAPSVAAPEHGTQPQIVALFERQQAALERSEAMLKEQQSALVEVLAEFRRLQAAPVMLRESVAQASQVANHDFFAPDVEPDADPPARTGSGRDHTTERLLSENQLLQKLLDEKDAELRQFRELGQGSVLDMPAVEDVDSYEAELVQYRRQLEADREKLNRDMDQFRVRNEELDEATREIEMQLSRERAELGRERIRLDRLRDEIQAGIERLQRTGAVQERLAPVARLRDEMVENRQRLASSPTPAPIRGSDPNLAGNIRTARGR